uniref:Rab3GAP regulatory subunit C-terminal domain-containing protein n=1 Tax=Ditylenchus dipsaci TaxID=166011 RepID=A0A915EKG3_9BILA
MITDRFIECLRNLLDILGNSSTRLETQKENHNRTLSQLASRHKAVNYHLVVHHIHLITAIQLQISLGISIRLKGLFDAVGRRAFFEPLHSHPLIPLANEIILLYQWALTKKQTSYCLRCKAKTASPGYSPADCWQDQMVVEEEPRLQLRVFQCSAASESTIVHVKQLSEELAPKFDEVKPSMIRAMIRNVGNLLTKASKTENSPSSSSSNFNLMDIGAKFKNVERI